MAKLEQEFNVNEVPEREEFSAIPPGAYTVMIVNSEIQNTSKGGQMIVLEMDIQDGEHSGRKLFDHLNIKNDNPKAEEIAYRTLAEIGKALGKGKIKDTEELHNKRLVVNVVVEPAKPYVKDGVQHPGKPQNSIKRYLPYTGGATEQKQDKQEAVGGDKAALVPSASQSASVPPWKKVKG